MYVVRDGWDGRSVSHMGKTLTLSNWRDSGPDDEIKCTRHAGRGSSYLHTENSEISYNQIRINNRLMNTGKYK